MTMIQNHCVASWWSDFRVKASQKFSLKKIKDIFYALSPKDIAHLFYDWSFWARPEQLPPATDWRAWLILAGRGFGKTRTGSEWVRGLAEKGQAKRIALIGATASDVRDVMIEGESGILKLSPPWMRPEWQSSKRRLVWPNGAQAFAYSADEPDRLRGPQHDALWADELAAWRYPETWDMALFGLRLGQNPRAVVTTTPKPLKIIKNLMNDPTTYLTKGTTFDNKANLPKAFIEKIIKKYDGTSLGAQEIYAEILEEVPGALWSRLLIDSIQMQNAPKDMERIIIAVDPAVTSHENSDETGIIVIGKKEGKAYVLEDLSGRMPADQWIKIIIKAYKRYEADHIIAEVNQGGDLIKTLLHLHAPNLPLKMVRATRGKVTRAEPIASLYVDQKIFHVGPFPKLEDQMCRFTGEKKSGSPDRVDALVWGMTELFLNEVKSDFQIWSL